MRELDRLVLFAFSLLCELIKSVGDAHAVFDRAECIMDISGAQCSKHIRSVIV